MIPKVGVMIRGKTKLNKCSKDQKRRKKSKKLKRIFQKPKTNGINQLVIKKQ